MRFIKYNCLAILATGLLLGACKKEGALLQVDASKASTSLTSNVQSVTFTADNDADTVLTFSWAPVTYGAAQPTVTYTLQLDNPADTATGWTKARSFPAGNNITSYGFKGAALNQLLNDMGFLPDNASQLAVRLKVDVQQYNGVASTVPSVYSNATAVKVTPYALTLWVPGAYQGWNPGAAPVIGQLHNTTGRFEGYVHITGADMHFKFTSKPDWNHTNYGYGGDGILSTDGLADGLQVPAAGYYELYADVNSLTWKYQQTTWGIIGDASPGGWDNDTPLSYDPDKQVWTATVAMKTAGSFKFRANKAWALDFGIDANGNLQYADNPLIGGTSGLNNLTVPEDGTYKFTLDLHLPGKYTYTAVKQ
ncbi:DUF5116 domain-containing protein [Chitinophaga parva]|uniref:DUF5116 domain-containing protein n=1 Tax=Chitinophaga parva TaxID=2169414 RepID=A0A2T7BHW4_9BACT|nr:SusF/SusE family outer membrane protein [Chitinophaga parva]PUZ25876.1 DUF5116 domain-containing protein [Chitinophaga parva]